MKAIYCRQKLIKHNFASVIWALLFLFGCGSNGDESNGKMEAPFSLKGEAILPAQIKVEWKHSGQGITGFSLERSLASENEFREIFRDGPESRSFSETILFPGTHYYRVRAFQKFGTQVSYSDYSNVDYATPLLAPISAPSDRTPPNVSFTTPADGTVISGSQELRIAAEATDDQSVASVEFYRNSEMIGADASVPFENILDLSVEDNGIHELYAIGYDASGNSARSSIVQISVNIPSNYIVNGLPVFPGAEGFGITTPAGRGGKIIKVTNLNAYGPGSLREAISTPGRRIIIFEVGGIIDLTYNQRGGDGSFLYLTEPYCTIAGHTAPYPGVTLKGAGFRIKTHDVLIQHLAIRPGDKSRGPRPDARDAISIRGPSYNVVIDHVSASWGVDENLDTWPEPEVVRDITVSNSIISEGLNRSIHPEGAHSKGFLIGDGSKNVAVIGNLFAHNDFRNPQSKGGVSAAIVNNVVYNPGRYNFMIGGSDNSGLGPNKEAFIGNLFIKGPNTTANIGIAFGNGLESGTAIYHRDNAFADGVRGLTFDSIPTLSSIEVSTSPVNTSGISVKRVEFLEEWVFKRSGSRPAERDLVDSRIVNEVKSRTGRIIDSQDQVGGWPQVKQTYEYFPIPSNPNGDDDGDGYSNIEELLHQRAAKMEIAE